MTEGASHPDRDAQFTHINATVVASADDGGGNCLAAEPYLPYHKEDGDGGKPGQD